MPGLSSLLGNIKDEAKILTHRTQESISAWAGAAATAKANVSAVTKPSVQLAAIENVTLVPSSDGSLVEVTIVCAIEGSYEQKRRRQPRGSSVMSS